MFMIGEMGWGEGEGAWKKSPEKGNIQYDLLTKFSIILFYSEMYNITTL